MKILIVSDSHGNSDILRELLIKYPSMDYYLHAGDSQDFEYNLSPFITVKGNCDYINELNEYLEFDTPLGKLRMSHFPPSSSLSYFNKGYKFYIHGHTHKRRHEEIDGLININPGSITFPRDNNVGTYAILEINENNYSVNFYEI